MNLEYASLSIGAHVRMEIASIEIPHRKRRNGSVPAARPADGCATPRPCPGISPSVAARRLKDKRHWPSLFSLASAFASIYSWPEKRSARKRARARDYTSPGLAAGFVCRANNGKRCSAAARCFNSVSKHTPTLLYGDGARDLGPLSRIRLTCDICSASETSRRERRDCAFLPDARRVEDISPASIHHRTRLKSILRGR